MLCNPKYAFLPVFFLVAFMAQLVFIVPVQADDTMPYYASFRSSEVNVRTGPGDRYPIEYVYKRRHLPIKVIDRFEHWRRIQDHEGDTGWVHRSLLSNRQSVISHKGSVVLKRNPTHDSPSVAEMGRDVVGVVQECQYEWCLIEAQGYKGWINKKDVWGVE